MKAGGDDLDFDRLIAESKRAVDTDDSPIDQNILDNMVSLGLGFDKDKIIAVSTCHEFLFSYWK